MKQKRIVPIRESKSIPDPGVPRPKEIDLSKSLRGCFGKVETEDAAVRLMSYWQHVGWWKPVRIVEYTAFLKRQFPKNPSVINGMFHGLVGVWFDDGWGTRAFRQSYDYLVLMDDYYLPTVEFILQLLKHRIEPSEVT